ncbi:zinc finger protein CONSTANS-LIKE 4-like [Vigna unguiculata]|uniref:Zinc finger protein CONSTANS n=1 Tax=Vigna unguiculata TaxID=3917 RepID=A0A4D6NVK6_VIGUN|nr:zinc finger protein CONSTANS-LIKE 4-like [Vigna unguiculata]QCE16325.1 zinc finger protein CONSTANS [Vigna unguiculata]
MASKLCDSCKSATATLYCRPDAAFLCGACDSKVHAANKLASRHPRVALCEVCEQAPAHVTCKADAAALCLACDRDIHSANPLASRHERLPVAPFYESVHSVKASSPINFLDDHRFFSDADADVSTEEAEAASWLLPTPKTDLNSSQYLFSESEPVPYIDLDYAVADPKADPKGSATADGVVPVQSNYEPFAYGYKYNSTTLSQSQSQMSQSVSSSSMEVGVVPDGNTMSEISNCSYSKVAAVTVTAQFSAADREARVLRYREKRKNRKFEKTIRYASRKAYAETRPRIKGRFAKRSDADPLSGYGVVPSC